MQDIAALPWGGHEASAHNKWQQINVAPQGPKRAVWHCMHDRAVVAADPDYPDDSRATPGPPRYQSDGVDGYQQGLEQAYLTLLSPAPSGLQKPLERCSGPLRLHDPSSPAANASKVSERASGSSSQTAAETTSALL